DTASGSPLRSVIMPRCAGISTARTWRAIPWCCSKSLRSTCSSKARATISAAATPNTTATAALRQIQAGRLSLLPDISQHHHVIASRDHHVQFPARHLLDAPMRGPRALLELQLARFHFESIAPRFKLLQLYEFDAV